MQQNIILRAKEHSEKVFKILQDVKEKESLDLKSKESELVQKL